MAFKLSSVQKVVLVRVSRVDLNGERYRAANSGERVTLASLHRARLLDRWAWRGQDGAADAAYEYALNPAFREELRKSLVQGKT